MKSFLPAALAVLALAFGVPAMAQDPSLHQVYEALQAGRVSEAQGMMNQVLRDHPDSGRAHYVEAEVLVREGRFGEADTELARAEKLAPGLPFAKADSVRELRDLIASGGARRSVPGFGQSAAGAMAAPAAAAAGFPWGTVLLLLGAVAVVGWIISRRNAARMGVPGSGYPGTAVGPAGPGMPGYGMPQGYPAPGGGLGSGIVGGLATGAAVGAGLVAGEALANEFIGGHHGHDEQRLVDDDRQAVAGNDLGGQDFGVSGGGWDDGGGGGGGGGDDWS